MKNWPLAHRILFIALAPVWIISALLVVLVVIVGTTEIDGAIKARGTVITRQLAPASEYGAFSGNREVLQALTQSVMKEDDAKAVVITDADNKVLAVSGKPSKMGAEHTRAADSGSILNGEHESLIFAAPIYQGKAESDAFDIFGNIDSDAGESSRQKLLGRVYVELSTHASHQSKNIFVAISIVIGLFGTACASVLAMRMSRDLTRPLSRLLDGVHHMEKGEFATRVPADSGGEMQELEAGFNQMAEKLESSHKSMMEINANLENLVIARTRELELRNQDLELLSSTDRLTGLYNRLKLEQILDEEHQRSQRYGANFAIAIIDIDLFKQVNDSYGHQIGDQVLVTIANILQEHVRSMDAVGRWGGEEFLVIFRETAIHAAIAIAEKLRCAIANHEIQIVGRKTASFGVTAYYHPDNVNEMMKRADNALYHAKKCGRNRVESSEM
ncbi:GGDEF domain-containing protein [Undibacterium sp. TS12]|uniref:GGDEF domain-containing protein n=1 Tax=Undibacterium sp. TS12 TaxID=2908202 RepID=UPI001F4C8DE2|nr:GGDEF domain-containing protein [Undibacterium sp. TS12]MCH8619840.1 diguanylate cyclase [Undibacterium sp. TS12]